MLPPKLNRIKGCHLLPSLSESCLTPTEKCGGLRAGVEGLPTAHGSDAKYPAGLSLCINPTVDSVLSEQRAQVRPPAAGERALHMATPY